MKKIIITIFLLMFVFASTSIRPVYAATRYIDSIFSDVETTKNISYGTYRELQLDVYAPKNDTETKRAAIIWVHGGSFTGGSKEQFQSTGTDYAKRGFVSFSINYRLTDHAVNPGSPDISKYTQQAKYDALAAVRWARTHANEYRIDPNRIIVAGSSAGAWTSLYAAYDTANVGTSGNADVSSKVAAAVSFAGGMSPKDVTLIEKGEPPGILLHGTSDTIVPIALPRGVYTQLQHIGIPSEFHTYPGGHGAPNNADAHEKVRKFLMTTLKLDQPTYIGDLDGNGSVNIVDFTLLMNYWFQNDVAKIDFNSDGKISVIDYTIFMNSWYDFLRGN